MASVTVSARMPVAMPPMVRLMRRLPREMLRMISTPPPPPGLWDAPGLGDRSPQNSPQARGSYGASATTRGMVALAMEAVANGHNVYFTTIPELLDELARDAQESRLSEPLTKLRVPPFSSSN